MTSHVQTQRFAATTVRPGVNTRPSGELWLNYPDLRLGMIDPTRTAIDLVPIRFYAATSTYAAGDLVFNASGAQLLQARNVIAPKPFASNDWNQFLPAPQNDARYLSLTGGTLTGNLTINAPALTINAPAGQSAAFSLTRQAGQVAQIVGWTGSSPRWVVALADSAPESTGNVGSNFEIVRFNDAGAGIDAPISIARSTGVVNFTQPPTLAGGVMPYVPLAGNVNMTGALGVGGAGISYPSLGTYWAAHHVAIGWDGAQPEFAADGVGIGALALQPWTVANFLSINGGTLHGGLNIQGRITWSNLGTNAHAMEFGWDGVEIVAWVDGTFIGGLATYGALGSYLPLTGGVTSGTVRVNNGRLQSSGSGNNPSVSCWDIAANFAAGIWTGANQLNFGGFDGSGTPTAFWGAFDSGGTLHVTGDLLVRGTDIVLSVVSPYYNLYFTNWVLQYDQTHGVLGWYDYTGLQLFYCDPSGNFRAHGDLNAGNGVNANGNIHAGLALQAIDGSMWFGSGGAGRIMQVANSWFWEWNGGNGDLTWTRPGGGAFAIRNSDGVCMDFMGPCGGVGAYQNFSDVRSKFDIAPAIQGLPEVLRLNPKTFKRIGKDRTEIGFIAQDIEQVLPEAVLPLGVPLPDGSGELGSETPSLGFAIDPIVAALVNAIKELASRIAILEANP